MTIKSPIIKIKGIVQEYDWGKDETSIISNPFGYESKTGKFAELWFGTHPKAPAKITDSPNNLLEEIKFTPAILGKEVLGKFGASLPFLFKVLSVNEALSIQAHPDAQRAPILHANDPKNYPDRFPKPEVGIAISPVKLLYGFRAQSEILNFLNEEDESFIPEFKNILEDLADLTYQKIYQRLVNTDAELIKSESQKLFARLKLKNVPSELEKEIIKLEARYPNGDLGIFCFYLLNFVIVEPGGALFINSNIPHAYLSGELLECMAPSDNVVRGGLTHKYIDQKTLLSMLDFQEQVPQILTLNPTFELSFYKIPDNDFFKIGKFAQTLDQIFTTKDQLQLIFCLAGEASVTVDYQVYPIPVGQAVIIPATLVNFQI